jgi:oligopeptide/dipeptide ABC transporter ATP-binding protein
VVRLHQRLDRKTAQAVCLDMLEQVNMPDPSQVLEKYPHELSGGMRQRVMIAMELSCRPDLLIADEPTTALDVTVQAQVLNILERLTRRQRTSVLFITHDLGVVAQICDRVAVMYAGKIVEIAPVRDLFAHPAHPYSQGLLQAIPSLEQEREQLAAIAGTVPGLINPPGGCRFHPRCGHRMNPCDTTVPVLRRVAPDHFVACHLYDDEANE